MMMVKKISSEEVDDGVVEPLTCFETVRLIDMEGNTVEVDDC
jgi:hypothetical protein